jgi:hypothetical protein
MLNVPLSVKIEEWRKKAAEGTLTTAEMQECIAAIRQGRVSASVRSASSRAAKAPVNVDDLLGEINNL